MWLPILKTVTFHFMTMLQCVGVLNNKHVTVLRLLDSSFRSCNNLFLGHHKIVFKAEIIYFETFEIICFSVSLKVALILNECCLDIQLERHFPPVLVYMYYVQNESIHETMTENLNKMSTHWLFRAFNHTPLSSVADGMSLLKTHLIQIPCFNIKYLILLLCILKEQHFNFWR